MKRRRGTTRQLRKAEITRAVRTHGETITARLEQVLECHEAEMPDTFKLFRGAGKTLAFLDFMMEEVDAKQVHVEWHDGAYRFYAGPGDPTVQDAWKASIQGEYAQWSDVIRGILAGDIRATCLDPDHPTRLESWRW